MSRPRADRRAPPCTAGSPKPLTSVELGIAPRSLADAPIAGLAGAHHRDRMTASPQPADQAGHGQRDAVDLRRVRLGHQADGPRPSVIRRRPSRMSPSTSFIHASFTGSSAKCAPSHCRGRAHLHPMKIRLPNDCRPWRARLDRPAHGFRAMTPTRVRFAGKSRHRERQHAHVHEAETRRSDWRISAVV